MNEKSRVGDVLLLAWLVIGIVVVAIASGFGRLVTDAEDLAGVLRIDTDRWLQEVDNRESHLAQFDGLPAPIWDAHRRVAESLRQWKATPGIG